MRIAVLALMAMFSVPAQAALYNVDLSTLTPIMYIPPCGYCDTPWGRCIR
jgi:hypothetical protein